MINLIKKILITSAVSASLLVAGGVAFSASTKAQAAPESCFDFNAATGAIVQYYQNQNNDQSQPACPKDVVIPSVIAGENVEEIGGGAFGYKALTSVVVPEGVTSIGSSAFLGNDIHSAVLPDSLVSMGYGAFSENKLTSVDIPSRLEGLDSQVFYANRLKEVVIPESVKYIDGSALALNQLRSVIIEGNPTLTYNSFNPNGIDYYDMMEILIAGNNPTQYIEDHTAMAPIYSSNQEFLEAHKDSMVGYNYIINPASLMVHYRNSSGADLMPSQNSIGGDSSVENYLLKNFYDIQSAAVTNQAALDSLYHIGDVIEVAPPNISGYVTPATVNYTLDGASNELVLTYYTQAELDAGLAPVGGSGATQDPSSPAAGAEALTGSNNGSDDQTTGGDGVLAETGWSMVATIASGLVAVVGGVMLARRF